MVGKVSGSPAITLSDLRLKNCTKSGLSFLIMLGLKLWLQSGGISKFANFGRTTRISGASIASGESGLLMISKFNATLVSEPNKSIPTISRWLASTESSLYGEIIQSVNGKRLNGACDVVRNKVNLGRRLDSRLVSQKAVVQKIIEDAIMLPQHQALYVPLGLYCANPK